MKKSSKFAPSAVGGSSLLVIFGVLCLTVLALLCLSTAQAEKRMAEAAVQTITAWYDADLEAQQIYARLRAGEDVPAVTVCQENYSFCVPISCNQVLEVALKKDGDHWSVLRWQAVANPEEINETLPVWQGYQ